MKANKHQKWAIFIFCMNKTNTISYYYYYHSINFNFNFFFGFYWNSLQKKGNLIGTKIIEFYYIVVELLFFRGSDDKNIKKTITEKKNH
jgi:hypothetical protein